MGHLSACQIGIHCRHSSNGCGLKIGVTYWSDPDDMKEFKKYLRQLKVPFEEISSKNFNSKNFFKQLDRLCLYVAIVKWNQRIGNGT